MMCIFISLSGSCSAILVHSCQVCIQGSIAMGFPDCNRPYLHLADRVSDVQATLDTLEAFDDKMALFGDTVMPLIGRIQYERLQCNATSLNFKALSNTGGIRVLNKDHLRSPCLRGHLCWFDSGSHFTPSLGKPREVDPDFVYDPGNNAYGRLHAWAALNRGKPYESYNDETAGDYIEYILAIGRELRNGRLVPISYLQSDEAWFTAVSLIEEAICAYGTVLTAVPFLATGSNGSFEQSKRWTWLLDEIRVGLGKKVKYNLSSLGFKMEYSEMSTEAILRTTFSQLPSDRPLTSLCIRCWTWTPIWDIEFHASKCCQSEEDRSAVLDFAASMLRNPQDSMLSLRHTIPDYVLANCPDEMMIGNLGLGKKFWKSMYPEKRKDAWCQNSATLSYEPSSDPHLDAAWCMMFDQDAKCASCGEVIAAKLVESSRGRQEYSKFAYCQVCWEKHTCKEEQGWAIFKQPVSERVFLAQLDDNNEYVSHDAFFWEDELEANNWALCTDATTGRLWYRNELQSIWFWKP